MQRLIFSSHFAKIRLFGWKLIFSVFFGFAWTNSFAADSIKPQLRASAEVKEPLFESKPSRPHLQDHKTLAAGLTVPMDHGRGYPSGYGYFLWKRNGWPTPTMDFRLAFAGPIGDAEILFRNLLGSSTDFGMGANYQTIGRLEEYHRGQIAIVDRMGVNHYSGRLFIQQGIVLNYIEIAKVRAVYEIGYENYYREDDTSPTFLLAHSGLFQTAKLHGGAGKLDRSLYAPKGWDLNFSVEATFRDGWRNWGPPHLWASSSQFQKFQLDGGYAVSTTEDQRAVFKLSGGLGHNLDRLAAFKLGSALTGLPTSLVLHGFYAREIFAEDFALANLDYVIPILKEQELAVHLYADGAVTRRSDIPDSNAHAWSGTGMGVSVKAWWETRWLVGYGYGINAQRGNDVGGHEFFVQMEKSF